MYQDPVNGYDLAGTWWGSGVLKKATHLVAKHWRGIAQTAVTATAIVGMGVCAAVTGLLCLAATPFVGAGVGAANYSLSGGKHTAEGYSMAFAEGGLVGSLSLICIATCVGVAIAGGVEVGLGAAQGVWDYSHSNGSHSFGGYFGAGAAGGLSNGPYPVDKWFTGGAE